MAATGIDYMTSPLSEFGQAPSPAPGASLKKVVARNDEHDDYLDRTKSRYVWMPLHDISLISSTYNQPMSVSYLYRGRIAWLQTVTYKGTDYSMEAFDADGTEELPFRRFVMTPKAQAIYLHINYATKGLQVFEHLKNEDPETVAAIEQVLLPTVPPDLIALAEYLGRTSPENVRNSGLSANEKQLAMQTLRAMSEGVSAAITYSQNLIADSESELLNRRNRGSGKSSLDSNDKYSYVMLRRAIPTEMTLENSSEVRQTELLQKLVDAMGQVRGGSTNEPSVTVSSEQVRELEAKLADLQTKLLDMAARLPVAETIQTPFEELTPVVVDEAPAKSDLKDRLDKSKRR